MFCSVYRKMCSENIPRYGEMETDCDAEEELNTEVKLH
jgi:hypothetical protein